MAYVDGFNLYNGLKEKHQRKYLWQSATPYPDIKPLSEPGTREPCSPGSISGVAQ
ncbi:MAG: hypothetical protein ACRDQA_15445 [Nocardioidaceae bacterium]